MRIRWTVPLGEDSELQIVANRESLVGGTWELERAALVAASACRDARS